MDYKLFLEHIKKRRDFPTHVGGSWSADGIILSPTYHNYIPWEFRYKLAEDAASVDFGCSFENNSCLKERENPAPLFFTPARSLHVNYCCTRCFQTIGNLLILPSDEEILKEIADLFEDFSDGFWKKDIGCSLPARYRSTMCLTGRCGYLTKQVELSKEDKLKLWKLTNIKQLWRAECHP